MNPISVKISRFAAFIFVVFSIVVLGGCRSSSRENADILIIGGGASGTAAGIQAARMGCKTLIVEEYAWLGGMLTSAGVSAVDGNYKLPAGIWGEFKDSLSNRYGGADKLRTGWVSNVLFEPSVGNSIFKNMVANEKNLNVWYNASLTSINKKGDKWIVNLTDELTVRRVEAAILIDATELGDVAKLCGVRYDIGMESRHDTREAIAPETANHIIQDLTYVAILKDYRTNVLIERPEGYDSTLFACAAINHLCVSPEEPERMHPKDYMIRYGKLPNNKYMINWPIDGNDFYVNLLEMNRDERTEALKQAKHFTMCFLYFLQNELGFTTLGLADDEFPTDDKLPFTPYHRESRRIRGKVRFTLNDITDPHGQPQKLYRTNVAVGDYPVDHHHGRYQGRDELPNLYFYPIPSYGLPLGTLIPENTEGLIVAEKSISVSNLVNGTTRLQPVVLQIGQAAGILAALAIRENKSIDEIPVRQVQQAMLESNGYLMPYLDVPPQHALFKIFQRTGVTGILQGEGRNVGWSNEMWLRCDDPLIFSELDGLKEIYPRISLERNADTVSLKESIRLIKYIAETENIRFEKNIADTANEILNKYDMEISNENQAITRGAFAVLVDELLKPFDKEIDIYGNFIEK